MYVKLSVVQSSWAWVYLKANLEGPADGPSNDPTEGHDRITNTRDKFIITHSRKTLKLS
jgi:hypothetical protein